MTAANRAETFAEFSQRHPLTLNKIAAAIHRAEPERIRIQKPARVEKNLGAIIEALLRLSNQHSFEATSLRMLADETGMSMGGLYAYFPGKHELLGSILSAGGQLISDIFNAEMADISDHSEKLSIALRTHLYASEALHDWFYFAFMEAKNLPPADQKSAQSLEIASEQAFANILADGAAAGVFDCKQPQMIAAHIKALLQDWYVKRWKYRQRGISVEHYHQQITDLALRFLTATIPA